MTNQSSSVGAGSLDAQLERAAGAVPGAPDIDEFWQRGRRSQRRQVLAMRSAMASVALIFGITAFTMASPPETIVSAASSVQEAVNSGERTGPPVGSHWHNVFGMQVCGEWQASPMSTIDEVGIHSHQDGLIHIHPWVESAANENATLGLFFDAMQITVSDDQIVLDNGQVLKADMSCDGEPSVLRLVRWALVDLNPEDFTVITSDFAAEILVHDRVGFALVIGPEDAPVEVPPSTPVLADVSPFIDAPGPPFDSRYGLSFGPGRTEAPVFEEGGHWPNVQEAIRNAAQDGVFVTVDVSMEAETAPDDWVVTVWNDLWKGDHGENADSFVFISLQPDGSRTIYSSLFAADVIERFETSPLEEADLIDAMVEAIIDAR